MKRKVTIIGGGSCALILACELDVQKFEVSIYEKNAAPGRKFLVAGEGGFNLTHSEDPASFVLKYTPVDFLQKPFGMFNNNDFIAWLNAEGIETFVGSSGRIFPKKGIKPIEVFNVLLEKIKQRGVSLHTKSEWKGFAPGNGLLFSQAGLENVIEQDLVVFCLGGASWPVTGSAGDWINYFNKKNIVTTAFEASNCAYTIDWPAALIPQIEGKALKNCSISCGGKSQRGEITLTSTGIEGSGIYPLSPQLRQQLHSKGSAEIFIDLKPGLSFDAILVKIKKSRTNKSFTKYLTESLNLNAVQMALLKSQVSKEDFLDPQKLSAHIKNLKLHITGTGSLTEAISTVGGIGLEEITENFELKKMPGYFVIGEMLDYDAPTGGYLLQSCFTMAKSLAAHLNEQNFA